ncbi:expressed unknown protein [Seminavis robusta]|uniref:TFIIH p62 subunit N-terminal domain-containing protein n=1 Tax=Seminavis robusta TaxID=568900 RepID=A0A9N8F281_9STRA|nr:expressed unknown protein [Seminavis robusta]|eukprot:Sro3408_g347700.1 n/a (319) ;mRNA; r:1955-2911
MTDFDRSMALDLTATGDLDNGDHDSFTTIDEYEVEHPEQVKAAFAAIGDPSHLLDAPLETSNSTVSDSSKSNASVYEKVKYHDEIGKIVLTDAKITFHPYDGGAPTRGSFIVRNHAEFTGSHSWRWKMIKKHKISPTTSSKTMLKLISAESDKKAVVFTFYNREQLELIRKDVTKHLRQAHHRTPKTEGKEEEIAATSNKKATNGTVESNAREQPAVVQEAAATEATALLGTKSAATTEQATSTESASPELDKSKLVIGAVVAVIVIIVLGSGLRPSSASILPDPIFHRALVDQQSSGSDGNLVPAADALQYLRGNLH